VHHIIAQSSQPHNEPKIWLKRYGAEINDSRNLVKIKKILHKHLHTTLYYTSVRAALYPFREGKPVEFFGVLGIIKLGLTIFSESLPS